MSRAVLSEDAMFRNIMSLGFKFRGCNAWGESSGSEMSRGIMPLKPFQYIKIFS